MENTIKLLTLQRLKSAGGDDNFNKFIELYKPKSELVAAVLGEGDTELDSNRRYQEYLELLQNNQPTAEEQVQTPIGEERVQTPTGEERVQTPNQPSTISSETGKNSVITSILNYDTSQENKEYLIKLAKRESSYQPLVQNSGGYFGLYQFGNAALKDVGMSKDDLKKSLNNQHKAALALANQNEKILKDIIQKYNGKYKNGVKLTRNGILAMAHLLGAGSVQDYFNNTKNTPFSKNGFVDGNKTHILEYAKLFS